MTLLRHRSSELELPPLAIFLISIAICCVIVLLAPWIGLGENVDFLLYRVAGISRSETLKGLIFLAFASIGVVGICQSWGNELRSSPDWSRPLVVAASVFVDASTVSQKETVTRKDSLVAAVLAAASLLAFLVLLSKCLIWFQFNLDQHWWQAMVDYDLEWGTPVFSFGANLLNNFGIQVPLNGHFLPFEGLAHLLPINARIPATVILCFLWTGALFWVIGSLFGLHPIYRAMFAGMVALMVNIPNGLDHLLWIFPPNFFTHQFALASWWGEAPILLLTTVVLFFFIGRCRTLWGELVASAGFAVGAFAAVLGYPVGGVFFVPLMALYCFGLILTCENRNEFFWKAGISGGLGVFMLIARVPQFFMNLYAYTFGSYFYEFSSDGVGTAGLIQANFLVYSHIDDLRGLFLFLVSFIGLAIAAVKATGPLRRIAIAALICEGGIITVTTTNAFVWVIPLAGAYAELVHAPLWGSFAVLAIIIFILILDNYLVDFIRFFRTPFPAPLRRSVDRLLELAIKHRTWIYGAVFCLVVVRLWWILPVQTHFSNYPPGQPPSIKLLAKEVGLSPGAQFRGRLMTWAPAEAKGPSDRTNFQEIVAHLYRRHLGNDHYIDALPFNIPMVNEYGHFTSPITFAFFRVFLAKHNEVFGRAWFLFSKFDLRIARLIGVRMVVTDGSTIPGGTLVYETMAGDTPFRIFRLEGTNVGQYSPVRAHLVSSAAEAVAAIASTSFEPDQDVVVEAPIPTDLVPAASATVTVDVGPRLIVRASSSGRSLLVLPFDYSHCLHLKASTDRTKLIPVNLQQTGLLFEGQVEAEITYRFGLFGDARCRGTDVERADRLDLRALFLRPPQ